MSLTGLLPPKDAALALRALFDEAFTRDVGASVPDLGLLVNGTLLINGKVHSIYLNRELSWLAFNRRVLADAESTRHPLLERLRFLSISFNNLDEFFMVRIAGLAQLVKGLVENVSPDGLTPAVQLSQTMAAAAELMKDQQRVWSKLQQELRAKGAAQLVACSSLDAADRAFLHDLFIRELWPQLTPQSIDNAHPFPFVPNKGMGLALTLMKRARRSVVGMGAIDGEAAGVKDAVHDKEGPPVASGGGSARRSVRRKRRGSDDEEFSEPLALVRRRSRFASSEEHLFEMEATHAAIPDEMRAIILLPPQLRRFVLLPSRNVTDAAAGGGGFTPSRASC